MDAAVKPKRSMSKKREKDAEVQAPARTVTIKPPKFEVASIKITGIAPYVQNNFAQKSRDKIMDQQRAGSTGRSKRQREAKDFEANYRAAMHVSTKGWHGIPAAAFRNALISACRTVAFKMTLAKLSIFTEADGFDAGDGTPLVKIEGKPEMTVMPVRNESGVVDMRARPMWREWSAVVRLRWDADQFTADDVVNLLARVGLQVGIGEGRPDSPNSNGMGWGLFEVSL